MFISKNRPETPKNTGVNRVVERLRSCVVIFERNAANVKTEDSTNGYALIYLYRYLYAGWLLCRRSAARGG